MQKLNTCKNYAKVLQAFNFAIAKIDEILTLSKFFEGKIHF